MRVNIEQLFSKRGVDLNTSGGVHVTASSPNLLCVQGVDLNTSGNTVKIFVYM